MNEIVYYTPHDVFNFFESVFVQLISTNEVT